MKPKSLDAVKKYGEDITRCSTELETLSELMAFIENKRSNYRDSIRIYYGEDADHSVRISCKTDAEVRVALVGLQAMYDECMRQLMSMDLPEPYQNSLAGD